MNDLNAGEELSRADDQAQIAADPNTVVVAIGASGTQFEPLERFLGALNKPSMAAFVVVLQQGDAFDNDQFRAAVQNIGGLVFQDAESGLALQSGHFYLAPSDRILTIQEGRFQTRPIDDTSIGQASIDSFLLSLAEASGESAIAVMLRGTGGDGSLGVTAIREHGGMVIAEEEDELPYTLSSSTHPAALADFRLAPEAMPERIAIYARQIAVTRETARLRADAPEINAAIGQIATVLRNKTGHDFHGYKPATFLRRVHRRMQVVGADTIESYIEVLRGDAAEPQSLFNDLLIGVTQFFRDGKEFELLERDVIPRMFEGKGASDQVRVWVLGCSTGEEAYSLGILMREHMLTLDTVPQVQIFATDIDGRALAAARVGRYADTISRDVSPARLARWFVKEGNTYSVIKEVREMCIFSGHNVIKDAPFSRLDLVSCRNLLIYLNVELQTRIIPLFHFALRSNGFLFLGNSENVTRHAKLFVPIDRRARIFRRIETTTRVMPDFPIGAVQVRTGVAERRTERRTAPMEKLARRAEHVAERFAPAYVIVDQEFDVLHFSGRTGRYIDPPSGIASLNILSLVHRDLRTELRAALGKALVGEPAVHIERVPMSENGSRLIVDLIVETLHDLPEGPRHFVVVFKDGIKVRDDQSEHAFFASTRDEHVRHLENELRTSRDRLQATIEELESTNEELKSSNEEYQSLNEELQSANEELETSKEELQSVNEELTTVNGELAQRVHELARTNSDLKNLLESTQIATVFLDNQLRVMNYTPAVTEVFPLVETDVGRPIGHIKAHLPLDELQDEVRRVLRTLGGIEREIDNGANGKRYIVRILPYRSTDNFIAGVVVTFVDITTLTRAEAAMRESEKRFRDLADLSPDGILINADGRLVYANRAAAALLGAASPDEICRLKPTDIVDPAFHDELSERTDRVLKGESNPRAELGFRRLDGSPVMIEVSAGPITWAARPALQVLLRDASERKKAQENQKLLLAELQHRVRNTLSVLRSIARRTAESSDTVEDYATHLDGRIAAFARVQAVVTRDPAAGIDLADMISDELQAYASGPDGLQVDIAGPALRLQAKAAETFGLAVHELATNAAKHGALSSTVGRVRIAWRIEADGAAPRFVFDWIETGLDTAPNGPKRRGFGTDLLERTLAYELRAHSTQVYGLEGVSWTISLPLTETFAQPDRE